MEIKQVGNRKEASFIYFRAHWNRRKATLSGKHYLDDREPCARRILRASAEK